MLQSSIGWILIASGVVTAVGGAAAFLSPRILLRFAFAVAEPEGATMFFVRHWGVLIFVVGALLVYSGGSSEGRAPILIAAAIEKAAVVGLVFFGPIKRTLAMTAIALADGLFAVTYASYLVSP